MGVNGQLAANSTRGCVLTGLKILYRNAIFDDRDSPGIDPLGLLQISLVRVTQRHNPVGEFHQPAITQPEVFFAAEQTGRVRRYYLPANIGHQPGDTSPQHRVVMIQYKKYIGLVLAKVLRQTYCCCGIKPGALEILRSPNAALKQLPAYTTGFFEEMQTHPETVFGKACDEVGKHTFGAPNVKRGGYERYRYFLQCYYYRLLFRRFQRRDIKHSAVLPERVNGGFEYGHDFVPVYAGTPG